MLDHSESLTLHVSILSRSYAFTLQVKRSNPLPVSFARSASQGGIYWSDIRSSTTKTTQTLLRNDVNRRSSEQEMPARPALRRRSSVMAISLAPDAVPGTRHACTTKHQTSHRQAMQSALAQNMEKVQFPPRLTIPISLYTQLLVPRPYQPVHRASLTILSRIQYYPAHLSPFLQI